MENAEYKRFVIYLLNKYSNDQNAELAEVLIKEYSAHLFKNLVSLKELQIWINNRSSKLTEDNLNPSKIFGLHDKWSRSKIELKYLNMNVYTWQHIFEGDSSEDSYAKTAILFSTTNEEARIGFERKNHDFGTRELSRFGLDIFIALNKRQLTSEEITIADEYLKEDIRVQMSKDLHHHRIKYKFTC